MKKRRIEEDERRSERKQLHVEYFDVFQASIFILKPSCILLFIIGPGYSIKRGTSSSSRASIGTK